MGKQSTLFGAGFGNSTSSKAKMPVRKSPFHKVTSSVKTVPVSPPKAFASSTVVSSIATSSSSSKPAPDVHVTKKMKIAESVARPTATSSLPEHKSPISTFGSDMNFTMKPKSATQVSTKTMSNKKKNSSQKKKGVKSGGPQGMQSYIRLRVQSVQARGVDVFEQIDIVKVLCGIGGSTDAFRLWVQLQLATTLCDDLPKLSESEKKRAPPAVKKTPRLKGELITALYAVRALMKTRIVTQSSADDAEEEEEEVDPDLCARWKKLVDYLLTKVCGIVKRDSVDPQELYAKMMESKSPTPIKEKTPEQRKLDSMYSDSLSSDSDSDDEVMVSPPTKRSLPLGREAGSLKMHDPMFIDVLFFFLELLFAPTNPNSSIMTSVERLESMQGDMDMSSSSQTYFDRLLKLSLRLPFTQDDNSSIHKIGYFLFSHLVTSNRSSESIRVIVTELRVLPLLYRVTFLSAIIDPVLRLEYIRMILDRDILQCVVHATKFAPTANLRVEARALALHYTTIFQEKMEAVQQPITNEEIEDAKTTARLEFAAEEEKVKQEEKYLAAVERDRIRKSTIGSPSISDSFNAAAKKKALALSLSPEMVAKAAAQRENKLQEAERRGVKQLRNLRRREFANFKHTKHIYVLYMRLFIRTCVDADSNFVWCMTNVHDNPNSPLCIPSRPDQPDDDRLVKHWESILKRTMKYAPREEPREEPSEEMSVL